MSGQDCGSNISDLEINILFPLEINILYLTWSQIYYFLLGVKYTINHLKSNKLFSLGVKYYWFPGPWTRVTSVVTLTTATAAAAAMFPNPKF